MVGDAGGVARPGRRAGGWVTTFAEVLRVPWLASEYLDDGRWGVLSQTNFIVIKIGIGLSREEAKHVAEAHNVWLEHQKRDG